MQGHSVLHHVTLATDRGGVDEDGLVHAGLKPDAGPRGGQVDGVRFPTTAADTAAAATVYPLESLGETVRCCEICNQRRKLVSENETAYTVLYDRQ